MKPRPCPPAESWQPVKHISYLFLCLIRFGSTYSLQLLSRHGLDALHQGSRLERLASVDDTGSNHVQRGLTQLSLVQGIELGVGNGLGHILLANRAIGNALQGLDSRLSTLADSSGRARELDSQETGIRVSQVRSRDGKTSDVRGGLREQAVSRSPLDSRLTTEERSQDGNLRLRGSVGRAGEGNNHGIASGVACPLLTAVVLGRLRVELLAGLRLGLDILEELANPLGEVLGGSTIRDQGQVRLRVDSVGEAGNVLLVQILLGGGGGRRVDGSTKAGVERNGVGVVESDGRDIGVESGLLESEHALNLLVKLVRYRWVNTKPDQPGIADVAYSCTWSWTRPRPGARQSRGGHRGGS